MRLRADAAASRRRRFLTIAVLFSLAVHLAAVLLLVVLPRVLPHEAPPREQGTIELLMVEQKGAQPSQAGQPESKPVTAPARQAEKPAEAAPPAETADKAPDKPVPPKGEAVPSPSKLAPAPAMQADGDEPVPPPSEQPPPEASKDDPTPVPPTQPPAEAKTEPLPPPDPPKAPVIDLEGTESESNAVVMGPNVLPALPDDRYRNRPPVYPTEAQVLGQHGAVVLTIHVAATGLAAGVDVTESSGFRVLDEAALSAVRKWHFHPAMKDGQAIPFDMPFRFIFEPY